MDDRWKRRHSLTWDAVRDFPCLSLGVHSTTVRLLRNAQTRDKELDQRLRELHARELPPRQRLAIERPTGAPRKRQHPTSFFFGANQ
ncbi:MAG: hypothetical protein EOQ71_09070 [Mesorhizobium sp.]|nr:hypothetical protein EOA51_30755 [Mesorhizobium sp. M1A.F.Ca.IN.020.32.1.1]RWG91838.1 MAG: hypothetical protein EOQ68_05535 [Mesorhizobium sp.]RWH09216.1 MAG: hypothetical protein EOQ71_09070 [Mesorhizobium sp.]